jgi:ABC-2 type transport system ATP-binding protein
LATVDCTGLTKHYRALAALEDFTLEVREGEIFGLLGPNGAGKTTLFRVLLGLTRATRGSSRILGDEVPISAGTLARMGAVVEEPAFYPWMTADRFLATMSDTRKVPVAKSSRQETLERVGLADVGKKPIKKFSQGMRQRLGLAQALMGRPELLVLDEPANGLDPAGIEWLRRLMKEEAAAGTTVLVSSHQLGEIEKVCDRVGILSGGRLLEVGSPLQVGGANERVRLVVDSADHQAAARALAHLQTTSTDPGVFFIEGAKNRDVAAALLAAGVPPDTLVRENTSLEQRFLELTGARQ